MGLFHEHCRSDRDSYVNIYCDNIISSKKDQFCTTEESCPDLIDLDAVDFRNYDYGSIMHYGRKAFSANGEDTIVPINPPNAQIGQRDTLSYEDIVAVNSLLVRVPEVIGMSLTDAVQEVRQVGLVPTITTPPLPRRIESSNASIVVNGQSPGANTELARGSTVQLRVHIPIPRPIPRAIESERINDN